MRGRLFGSLRGRIVALAVAGTAMLVVVLLLGVDRLRAVEAEQSVAQVVRATAGLIGERVEPALAAGDRAALQRALRRVVEQGAAVAVVVLDRDHRVAAAEPAAAGSGTPIAVWPTDAAEPVDVTLHGVPARAAFQVVRGREDDLGGVWTAVDLRPFESAVGRLRLNMALIALAVLALGIGGALLAARLLVRPLEEMTATLAAVAQGQLDARQVVAGAVELQGLALQVNRVAASFASARSEQERIAADLERQVSDRTRQIEQNNRLLRQIGQQDLLTGLPNRAGLDEFMGRYVSLCRRSRQPLAVIMLDLDGFKSYNDTLGHAAGDKLLCTVAAALKGRTRGSDIVARWGGDEFCILIPFTTPDRALTATEGFIAAIADATRDLPRSDAASALGASAGVACFPEDGEEIEELFNRADAALYRAKAAGKGRVFRASSPQPDATT